jgi:radical SAM protein (TIGR01212 family)
MKQTDINPFEYTDSNKRYYTYNYYLKKRFGKKCAKITLDCGFSCPNIDGTRGVGGCIYCSSGSSSENCRSTSSIKEQYKEGIKIATSKWQVDSFIPYMQAYTNTHTSLQNLERITNEIASFENAVMIDIATRADCLENEKIMLLDKLSKKIPVTIELGLQSANDKTADLINRCHSYEEFKSCFYRIRELAPNIKIGIHIINGLPAESYEDMISTVKCVSGLHPDLVKIHLLHVNKNTVLAEMYEKGEYIPMSREDYIKTVCDQIELLPPNTVIERVTGDGIGSELIAPEWSKKKVTVINDIDKELFRRNSYQGIKFKN